VHLKEKGDHLVIVMPSETVHELGFAVSTVVKDAARINEYVKFIFYLVHVCLSHSGYITGIFLAHVLVM
jgi:hypothetical protein